MPAASVGSAELAAWVEAVSANCLARFAQTKFQEFQKPSWEEKWWKV